MSSLSEASVQSLSAPSAGTIIPTPKSNVLVLRRKIGHGSFSVCWLGQLQSTDPDLDEDPTPVVVKVINPGEKPLQTWHHESQIHRHLAHPNIVRMMSAFVHDKLPICVLEWCRGGTVSRLAKKTVLDVAEITRYTRQLLTVVAFLHDQQHIVHRDIKPSNVLLNDACSQIKLCDFGLAVRWDPARHKPLTKVTGTPNYVAPEIIKKDSPGYTNLVDCWSLGCTIYYMFTGHALYAGSGDRKALYRAIRKKALPTLPVRCLGPLRRILGGLLQKKTSKRMSAQTGLDHLVRH